MTKSPHYPVPGKDYPQTWIEFVDWFQDDTSCATFLERLRWPDEFVCPKCHEKTKPLRTTRGRFTCLECRHESTVTTGTIFHSTKTPLRTWFATVWYVTNQKQGTNALGLQRVMGFKSYQTAWTHLHKLRRAMVGQIEINSMDAWRSMRVTLEVTRQAYAVARPRRRQSSQLLLRPRSSEDWAGSAFEEFRTCREPA